MISHHGLRVAVAVLAGLPRLIAADSSPYLLTQNYLPHNLTDGFVFRTAADYPGTGDPTHGFVNYVGLDTATAAGLVKVVAGSAAQGAPFSAARKRNEQLYLGVDHTTVLNVSSADVANSSVVATTPTPSAAGRGRSSVRLESRATFSRGLLVADFAHMPAGQCGVWPAFWAYNFKEDPVGEVDLLEGVNHQAANMVSLHTGGTCEFGASADETGVDRRDSCTVVYGNASTYGGCGVTAPATANTYGTAFNRVGGGVYAALLEADQLRVWHWPRGSVPADVQQGAPDPSLASNWGRPLAVFSQANGGCDVAANFHTLTLILNTDFCGINQANGIWNNDAACAAYPTCEAFVASHPEAFNETAGGARACEYDNAGQYNDTCVHGRSHATAVVVKLDTASAHLYKYNIARRAGTDGQHDDMDDGQHDNMDDDQVNDDQGDFGNRDDFSDDLSNDFSDNGTKFDLSDTNINVNIINIINIVDIYINVIINIYINNFYTNNFYTNNFYTNNIYINIYINIFINNVINNVINNFFINISIHIIYIDIYIYICIDIDIVYFKNNNANDAPDDDHKDKAPCRAHTNKQEDDNNHPSTRAHQNALLAMADLDDAGACQTDANNGAPNQADRDCLSHQPRCPCLAQMATLARTRAALAALDAVASVGAADAHGDGHGDDDDGDDDGPYSGNPFRDDGDGDDDDDDDDSGDDDSWGEWKWKHHHHH
ncbi:uncharacterized protein SPSK_06006 [Sporothrix schenckii 1099-18]|uniref:GH16 domain-containing protein n=1 Tax=Sporothrix schenckii 1099-18 TaxID=1397361 RepID=A0A0F2MMA2_SPOSC|nr:uncharacterized protein SPSK_06006 [Sporothrix schenckii 1099-18]KJR89950.1 hypothetical protein SPSK_06006 [Sporothrix schenckii 1099-18]